MQNILHNNESTCELVVAPLEILNVVVLYDDVAAARG
jgi:hypothetical protein